MKHASLLIVFLMLLGLPVYADITELLIRSKTSSSYLHEYTYIDMEAVGADDDDNLEFKLNYDSGSIKLKTNRRQSSYVEDTINQTRYSTVTNRQFLITLATGDLSFSAEVFDKNNPEKVIKSETLTLATLDQPAHNSGQRSFINIRSKPSLLTGEEVQLFYEIFSDDNLLIGKEQLPEIPIPGTTFIDAVPLRYIYLDGKLGCIYTLPVALFTIESPGEYIIPAQDFNLDVRNKDDEITFYTLKSPEKKLEIVHRPESEISPFFIGRDFEIILEGFPDHNFEGDFFSFDIRLQGIGNMNETTSLSSFFRLPKSIDEKYLGSYKKDRNGEVISIIDFSYSGKRSQILGLNLPDLEIPIFDTLSGKYISNTISFPRIKGTHRMLIIVFGIILIMLIAASVFCIKIIKDRKSSAGSSGQDEILRQIAFSEQFGLTRREQEIFKVLLTGKSTREIADQLYISPETVKKHINNILKKTESHSRYEIYTKFINFS